MRHPLQFWKENVLGEENSINLAHVLSTNSKPDSCLMSCVDLVKINELILSLKCLTHEWMVKMGGTRISKVKVKVRKKNDAWFDNNNFAWIIWYGYTVCMSMRTYVHGWLILRDWEYYKFNVHCVTTSLSMAME